MPAAPAPAAPTTATWMTARDVGSAPTISMAGPGSGQHAAISVPAKNQRLERARPRIAKHAESAPSPATRIHKLPSPSQRPLYITGGPYLFSGVSAAEGPAVKRGHRQRSLPYAGRRPHFHAGPRHSGVECVQRRHYSAMHLLRRWRQRSRCSGPMAARAASSSLPVPWAIDLPHRRTQRPRPAACDAGAARRRCAFAAPRIRSLRDGAAQG